MRTAHDRRHVVSGPRAVARGDRLHRGEAGHRRDIGGADVVEGEPAEAPHRRLIEPARGLGEARQHQRRILEGIEAAGKADAQGVARGEGRRREPRRVDADGHHLRLPCEPSGQTRNPRRNRGVHSEDHRRELQGRPLVGTVQPPVAPDQAVHGGVAALLVVHHQHAGAAE